MRGRKPKPIALRSLGDRSGPRQQARGEIPLCPEHLDARAREEWERIAPRLAALGLLSGLDRAALAAYCVAWSRWVAAEAEIAAADRLTVPTARGTLKPHPCLGVARLAMRDMRDFLVEFGLTPSSRARVGAAPIGSPEDPSERFFARPSRLWR
jgi:P27 family predicted phage terminase small subunit